MSLANDNITLIKSQTGERIEGIKSSLQRNRIYILDRDNRSKVYNIEIGDYIERYVRGVSEQYRVTEPNYQSSSGSLSGYQSYIERVTQNPSDQNKQSNGQFIILCVSSDPKDEARLRLGEETRSIRERIDSSRYRGKFSFEVRHSVRITDFIQAIHDVQPNIIHFSGHGGNGEICFEDATGNSKLVPPSSLQKLFDAIDEPILCVVINACESEPQAKAIAQNVPYVIGMNESISDDAAISFSTGFYMALANGKSCDSAFKFGVAQIAMEAPGEEDIPVIHKNSQIDTAIDFKNNEDLELVDNFVSSNIKSFSYNKSDKTIEIKFHSGAIYAYKNAGVELFNNFKAAPSKGKFHKQYIKDQYQHEKVN